MESFLDICWPEHLNRNEAIWSSLVFNLPYIKWLPTKSMVAWLLNDRLKPITVWTLPRFIPCSLCSLRSIHTGSFLFFNTPNSSPSLGIPSFPCSCHRWLPLILLRESFAKHPIHHGLSQLLTMLSPFQLLMSESWHVINPVGSIWKYVRNWARAHSLS